jgi:toxin ParE1/3/4
MPRPRAYRTSSAADQDIIDIYVQGAALFGRAQAERYHQNLARIFTLLAANPRMARLRTGFTPPVRLHPHQAHLIAYVEDDAGILVLRVLHARQDWLRHLRDLP